MILVIIWCIINIIDANHQNINCVERLQCRTQIDRTAETVGCWVLQEQSGGQ